MAKENYSSVNGLRAYSMICIVMMHVLTNIKVRPVSSFFFDKVVASWGQLVLLFMMVSAFGLCCGYYEKFKNGGIAPSKFYRKRFCRILPFFALITLVSWLFDRTMGGVAEAFSNITLVFGLYPDANIEICGVGWFLGTIFVFYMIYPFFVFLLDNKKRGWFVLLLALVWQALMIGYYNAAKNAQILYVAPYFVMGGLIYLYRRKYIVLFLILYLGDILCCLCACLCLFAYIVFLC